MNTGITMNLASKHFRFPQTINPFNTKDFFLAFTLKNCIFFDFKKSEIDSTNLFGDPEIQHTLHEMTHFFDKKTPFGYS